MNQTLWTHDDFGSANIVGYRINITTAGEVHLKTAGEPRLLSLTSPFSLAPHAIFLAGDWLIERQIHNNNLMITMLIKYETLVCQQEEWTIHFSDSGSKAEVCTLPATNETRLFTNVAVLTMPSLCTIYAGKNEETSRIDDLERLLTEKDSKIKKLEEILEKQRVEYQQQRENAQGDLLKEKDSEIRELEEKLEKQRAEYQQQRENDQADLKEVKSQNERLQKIVDGKLEDDIQILSELREKTNENLQLKLREAEQAQRACNELQTAIDQSIRNQADLERQITHKKQELQESKAVEELLSLDHKKIDEQLTAMTRQLADNGITLELMQQEPFFKQMKGRSIKKALEQIETELEAVEAAFCNIIKRREHINDLIQNAIVSDGTGVIPFDKELGGDYCGDRRGTQT